MNTITIGNDTYELSDDLDAETLDQLTQGKGRIVSSGNNIDDNQSNNPLNVVAELAGSLNKTVLETIDFFGPDTINAILSVSGSEEQIPRITDLAQQYGIGNQGYMKEGLARDTVQAIGQTVPLAVGMQAAIRKAPEMASEFKETVLENPTISSATKDYLKRLPENLKASIGSIIKAAKDESIEQSAKLAALSATGGQVGEEIGGDAGRFIGEIAAPTIIPGIGVLAKKSLDKFLEPRPNIYQEKANEYLEHVISDRISRAGLNPEELPSAVKAIDEKEAVLADLGPNFQRTLRQMVNESPEVEASANKTLQNRAAGQDRRILAATNSEGYHANLDQAIEKLRIQTQPSISELYKLADQVPMDLSPWLKRAIKGERVNTENDPLLLTQYKDSLPDFDNDTIVRSTIYKLQPQVQERLANYELLGKPITNFSIIDETKKVLDDEIKRAIKNEQNSKVREFTALKNRLIEEADAINPYYKKARNLFAGKAALENAAKLGQSILHPSLTGSDIKAQTLYMSPTEKDFYYIGARDAIHDKIEKTIEGGNLARKLFNKRGDKEKIRSIFRNEEDFNRYIKALETEFAFAKTKNAAEGNSTTALQAGDMNKASGAFRRIIEGSLEFSENPGGLISKIKNLVKRTEDPSFSEIKSSTEYKNVVNEIGEMMLLRGDDLDKVIKVAKSANAKQLSTIAKTLERDQNKIERRVKMFYSKLIAPITYAEMGNSQNETTQ